MNQYLFLHVRGFAAPFAADERCRGSIVDSTGRMIPIMVLPSVCNDGSRLTLARAIAENLNAEAAAHAAGRQAAHAA